MFHRIVVAIGADREDVLLSAASHLRAPGKDSEILPFHAHPRRPGDTLDELLQHTASVQADLLVMGARSHVMARRLAMLAPCSVLMLPAGSRFDASRVLIPVDFSETSAEAVREGARLAGDAGGEGTVLAVESDDDPWLDWREEPDRLIDTLEKFVEDSAGPSHRLECLVEPVEHSTLALGLEIHQAPRNIEGADIAATIVATAERLRSTLLVMGTRGRTKAASILLGSVTEKVVQISPIPVLAVKLHGERLGLLRGVLERLRAEQPPLVVN